MIGIGRGGAAALPVPPGPMRRFLAAIAGALGFLAALTAIGATTAGDAVDAWRSDLAGAMTVSLPPIGEGTAEDLGRVLVMLRATPGVSRADPIPETAARRLLRPWLGEAADLPDLPLPQLVALTIEPRVLDVVDLRDRLTRFAGVRLDDHQGWRDGAAQVAGLVGMAGVTAVLLVLAVAAGAVAFATHASLLAHRDVVEVLHLIGARDGWIARAFAGRAAVAAGLGAGIGVGLAALLVLLAPLLADALPAAPRPLAGWIAVALVPPATIVCAWLAAWMTVMRTLARMP
jgi:cell division transport system permease protein